VVRDADRVAHKWRQFRRHLKLSQITNGLDRIAILDHQSDSKRHSQRRVAALSSSNNDSRDHQLDNSRHHKLHRAVALSNNNSDSLAHLRDNNSRHRRRHRVVDRSRVSRSSDKGHLRDSRRHRLHHMVVRPRLSHNRSQLVHHKNKRAVSRAVIRMDRVARLPAKVEESQRNHK